MLQSLLILLALLGKEEANLLKVSLNKGDLEIFKSTWLI